MVTGRAPSRAQPVAATCYTYLRTRRGTRSIASDAEARLPARERLVLGIELRVLVHRLRRTGLVACLVQNPEPAMSKRSSDSKVGPELPGVLEGAKSSSSWGCRSGGRSGGSVSARQLSVRPARPTWADMAAKRKVGSGGR